MARTAKNEKALTPEDKLAQALVPFGEQPYHVPGNWCWVHLEYLKNGVNDFFDGDWILSENMDPEGTVRLLQLSDIGVGEFLDKSNKYISESTYNRLGCSPLHDGDVMISRMAEPIARSCIVPALSYTVITAVDVAVMRCNQEMVLNQYLNFLCNAKWFTDCAFNLARGTTRLRITRKNLGEMPVPIPPFAEQQRIVDRIESLFDKLDEAKEKAQTVVDGFEDRRAAILHKAFTGELTEEWRQNNGVSRDTWNNYTIGDMFIHTTGKALKKSNTNGSLHKYITTSNLYWGRFDFSEVREMYFTDEELDKCTAKKGDLLICNGGDVGRAAIWNYDYDICIQNHISKLRKKQNNIDVVFCYYFFMLSKIKGKINSKGIGIASLSAKDLLAMRIDVPSIEEQHEISSILDELFNNEQQAKEAAEQVIDQIDAMKKSILARAFRGELGTNDPSEESAVELLKRVL